MPRAWPCRQRRPPSGTSGWALVCCAALGGAVPTAAAEPAAPLADANATINRAARHGADVDTDDWAAPDELAYARLQLGGGEVWRPHVVLVVLAPHDDPAEARAAVLDSLIDEVRPLARRPDLDVRVSFNAEGVWPGLARGPAARPADRLQRWARVLARVAAGEPVPSPGLREAQVPEQVDGGAGRPLHRVAAVGRRDGAGAGRP
jgi:hypothetical protein